MADVPEGKRVTWAEALFDLVFVFAITQVASLVGNDQQWWGLGRAVVVLAFLYRTWITTSLQSNRLGSDSTWDRVTMFGVALCGLVMAIALPHAYAGSGLVFALAFWAARLLTWSRYASQYQAKLLTSMGLSVAVIGPLVVIGSLLPEPYRATTWAVAAVLDMSLVAFFGRQHALIHYDHGHLTERYGLFVIIALGEAVVDLSLPLTRTTTGILPADLVGVAVCFLVVVLLWWLYFDHSNAEIALALESAREHVVLSRHLAYGHFGIIGGLVLVAIGLEDVVGAAGTTAATASLNLLYAGTMLMLAAMVYLRWAMSRVVRLAKVTTIVLLAVCLAGSVLVPGLVSTGVVVVLLLALIVVEKRWAAAWSRSTRPA